MRSEAEFRLLQQEIVNCRRCPRLVEWRGGGGRGKGGPHNKAGEWGGPPPALRGPGAAVPVLGAPPAALPRRVAPPGRPGARGLFPPEPAEHADRAAHAPDVSRRLPPRAKARRCGVRRLGRQDDSLTRNSTTGTITPVLPRNFRGS